MQSGRDTHVLTWRGTAVNSILAVLLTSAGLDCEAHEVGVTIADTRPDQVRALLDQVSECPPLEDLAPFVKNLRGAKFDSFLPEDLLARHWAARNAPFREHVSNALEALRSAET